MTDKQDFTKLTNLVCEHLAQIEEVLKQYSEAHFKDDPQVGKQIASVAARVKAIEALATSGESDSFSDSVLKLDSVTGLPEREAFEARLKQELTRFKRYHRPLTLAVLCIDDYDGLVSKKGSGIAEKSVGIIAKYITSRLRSVDFVARNSRDEFVMIFPETHEQQTKKAVEKLRTGISRIPFKVKGSPFSLTVSLGVTECVADDSMSSVKDRVRLAVRYAQTEGGDTCVVESRKEAQRKKTKPMGISQEFPVVSTSFTKF